MSARRIDYAQVRTGGHTGPPLRRSGLQPLMAGLVVLMWFVYGRTCVSAHRADSAPTRAGGHIGPPLQRATRLAVLQQMHSDQSDSFRFTLVTTFARYRENPKSPRGDKTFSTWRRFKTSEESNDTSEESFCAYVKNKKYPRGKTSIPTWISI